MSTAPVSTPISSTAISEQSYFQERGIDLQQLGQALDSGDVNDAQQAFTAIQNLGQNGPFGGNAFLLNNRQQDFNAIGQALQSGDLAGAQQAFANLEATFKRSPNQGSNPSSTPASTSNSNPGPSVIIDITEPAANTASTPATPAASSTPATPAPSSTNTNGPEIVLNLGNASGSGTPEEITLSFNNTSSGEQLTIGVGSQQNPNAQELTLNLPQNGNEQIVLNLLGNASSTTPASSSQTGGLNVVA